MSRNKLSDRVASIVCRTLMFLGATMAVTMLSGTYTYAADKTVDSKPDYRDSIANDSNVYNDLQARSVIRYLQELYKTYPADSMRIYATEALLNYSWYLIQNREWYLCRNILHTARKYCPDNNLRLSSQINTAIAGTKLYAGEYDAAGELLLKSNRYFEQIKDTAEWLKTCVNLGLYYSKIHKNAKALEYYEKVLAIADHSPYEMYYSIVTGYAANIEEDTIIGLSTFEKALRISLDNGHAYLLASNYDDLAHYYFRMENYHEALANARKSRQYADRYNMEDVKRSVLSLMADIYYKQKDYVAAYRMESEYNNVVEKNSERFGRNIYSNLNMADSLVDWVKDNIPLSDSAQSRLSLRHCSQDLLTIVFTVITLLSLIVTGILVFRRKKKDPKLPEESEFHNDVHLTDSDIREIPDVSKGSKDNNKDAFMTEATAINTVAESFNPTLDRIRNMLKDIPKSGNPDVDTKVRNLHTALIQSRLPEPSNSLTDEIRRAENDFSNRLSATYTTLTRSDLRMALYIKSGLGVQHISSITGMQSKSVNQARYRLRKALGLGQDDSLEGFLKSF